MLTTSAATRPGDQTITPVAVGPERLGLGQCMCLFFFLLLTQYQPEKVEHAHQTDHLWGLPLGWCGFTPSFSTPANPNENTPSAFPFLHYEVFPLPYRPLSV